MLSGVAESLVNCQECGYEGAIPIISKYPYCKCGAIPGGKFPSLRII